MDKKEIIKEARIIFDKISNFQRVNSQDLGIIYQYLTGKTYKHVNCPQCIKDKIYEMKKIVTQWESEPCLDCKKEEPKVLRIPEEPITIIQEVEECCSEHIEVPDVVIPKTKKIKKKKNGL